MRSLLLASSLAAFAAVGCGKAAFDNKTEPIALDQIPETAMQAAREKLPDVTFERAWKFTSEGEDAYEIKGKTKQGKTWEVEVTASGKILEVE